MRYYKTRNGARYYTLDSMGNIRYRYTDGSDTGKLSFTATPFNMVYEYKLIEVNKKEYISIKYKNIKL
jgi:hypothetical protein